MRYFKLKDENNLTTQYISIEHDDMPVLKDANISIEELSKKDFETATTMKTSRWDLFMPTINN